MKNALLALTLVAAAVPVIPAIIVPAQARDHYDRRYYNNRGEYREPRRLSNNDRVWQDRDGRYRCRRSNGTTGLIIGGVGGAVLGNIIDGGHNRAVGTIVGGAAGALAGRSIDRSKARCR